MLLWELLQHKPRSSVSNGLNIALLCGGSFIWSRNNEERFFLSQLTIIEAIGKKFIVFRINDFRICFRRENGLSGQWFFPVSMSFLKTYPRESEVMTVLIFHTSGPPDELKRHLHPALRTLYNINFIIFIFAWQLHYKNKEASWYKFM